MQKLQKFEDLFGRRFSYLRLSLTDVCNFRCAYCLPNGYQPKLYQKDAGGVKSQWAGTLEDSQDRSPVPAGDLSEEEILRLVRAMAELGTKKIRLTGGEPTLRRDLVALVSKIKRVPGISKVALSTNGTRLSLLAQPLFEAGLDAVNVSLDSLDPGRFFSLVGRPNDEILRGIQACLDLGFGSVKVNAVIHRQSWEEEFRLFLEWVRMTPVTVRWIELMETADAREYFKANHVSASSLQRKLIDLGFRAMSRDPAAGPAVEFTHPEYLGKMGIIAPYSPDFCSTCNRLRVTSRGELRLCLFGKENHPLRHFLAREEQRESLKSELTRLLLLKEEGHGLRVGEVGNNRGFSAMGG